eukprot:CAMPEP_0177633294 /NCGR_PEP_ID=MMETSP0447-20121125/2759_1 /TAXON_ID=0 /ORGANISM="Stygamoeba regulata, Strain BSH-02190019" /LENGTH=145 /DNA_ID=CAMNT_0019134941 /DNA_START=11 /DNA_END=448 /DNA_ORIENTATION=-
MGDELYDVGTERTTVLHGGCFCKAVRFAVRVPASLHVDAYVCNCEICVMKQNHHFVVRLADMVSLQGAQHLTLFQFGTMTAHHLFCSVCGVCPFYRPRSNPEGYAITLYCIDPPDRARLHVTRKTFDGVNWEAQILTSDIREKTA